VLDVIEDEGLIQEASSTGSFLRSELVKVLRSRKIDCIGDVRGIGLATGIEVVFHAKECTLNSISTSDDSLSPSPTFQQQQQQQQQKKQRPEVNPMRASSLRTALKRRGVLVGVTGPSENVLKIRPPLAFGKQHVPLFIEALLGAIKDTEPEDVDKNQKMKYKAKL
jgi:4-aminobutyrate aminotransferase-like enzyme